jgi:hypothetical protein
MKRGIFIMHESEGHPLCKGQGLNEYGLVGIILIALVLPAIIWLSHALKNNIQGWSDGMAYKPRVVSPVTPSTGVSSGQQNNVAIALPPSRPAGPSLSLPVYPPPLMNIEVAQPLLQRVTTLGANGATTIAADKIIAVARELKAQGKITDAQYNLLMKLANQGHRLGAIEKLIEDVGMDATNIRTYNFTTVTFEGRRYTVEELGDLIGYRPPSGSKYSSSGRAYTTMPRDLLNPAYGAQRESQAFIDLYSQVERSGVLSDPTVKQIISQLSSEIIFLSEAVDQAKGLAFAAGDINPGDIQASVVSTVTHANSAQICATGNGKDTNNYCHH